MANRRRRPEPVDIDYSPEAEAFNARLPDWSAPPDPEPNPLLSIRTDDDDPGQDDLAVPCPSCGSRLVPVIERTGDRIRAQYTCRSDGCVRRFSAEWRSQ